MAATNNRLTGDFRKHLNKTYLGSWDVPEGEDLIVVIDYCEEQIIKSERGESTEVVAIFKDAKPMILNRTNQNSIATALGSKKFEDWENRAIALFVNPNVAAFGKTVEALRVREYAPKVDKLICVDCGQVITDHAGNKARTIAERARTKYGVYLCWDCGKFRAQADAVTGEGQQ